MLRSAAPRGILFPSRPLRCHANVARRSLSYSQSVKGNKSSRPCSCRRTQPTARRRSRKDAAVPLARLAHGHAVKPMLRRCPPAPRPSCRRQGPRSHSCANPVAVSVDDRSIQRSSAYSEPPARTRQASPRRNPGRSVTGWSRNIGRIGLPTRDTGALANGRGFRQRSRR